MLIGGVSLRCVSVLLLACLSISVRAEVLIHFRLVEKTLALPEVGINDPQVLSVAAESCRKIASDFKVPEFFCLSQVQFKDDGQLAVPERWEQVVAAALQAEVSSSSWLTQRLGVSKQQMSALDVEQFISVYLKDPTRSKIIRAWLQSRADHLR